MSDAWGAAFGAAWGAAWGGGSAVEEEEAESISLLGGWVRIGAARRVQISGEHRGVNWSTCEAIARVSVSGSNNSRSRVLLSANAVLRTAGHHVGLSLARSDSRSTTRAALQLRRRNEQTAVLILTILRNKNP